MTTEAGIKSWIKGYGYRNWDQLCQALMWQQANALGTVVSTPGSAIEAYYIERDAGRIKQGTPPPGSYVYWEIGKYGHVGYMMNDGRIFMATTHLREEWANDYAGWNTLDGYSKATGAHYLGWSYKNGGNSVPFTPDSSSPSGGGSTPIGEIVKYTRFQNPQDYVVRMADQPFPVAAGGGVNLAAGTGGTGLYELNMNFYLKNFVEGAQIEGYLLLRPTGKDASAGYKFTIEGAPSGVVKAVIPAVVNIQSAATLELRLRTVKGPEPTVDLWGADVFNFG